jgi:cell division protein FtsA
VNARLGEMMELVRAEFKKIGKDGMLPGGVVLTGGGANLAGIEEFAKEALKLPVVIGRVGGLTGLAEKASDPGFTAAIGLMLENMTVTAIDGQATAKISQTVDKIKKTLRNLLP